MITNFLLILSLPLIAVALRSSQTLVYTVSLFPYSSPLRGEVTRHGESYPHLSLAKQVSFPCRFRPELPALLSSPVASSRTNPYSPMSGFQPACLLRSSHEVWASPLSKGVARRPDAARESVAVSSCKGAGMATVCRTKALSDTVPQILPVKPTISFVRLSHCLQPKHSPFCGYGSITGPGP